jgi:hypothetical protein
LGDDCGGKTCDYSRAKIDSSLSTARQRALVDTAVDEFGNLLKDQKLGTGVWNSSGMLVREFEDQRGDLLLEENRSEA